MSEEKDVRVLPWTYAMRDAVLVVVDALLNEPINEQTSGLFPKGFAQNEAFKLVLLKGKLENETGMTLETEDMVLIVNLCSFGIVHGLMSPDMAVSIGATIRKVVG